MQGDAAPARYGRLCDNDAYSLLAGYNMGGSAPRDTLACARLYAQRGWPVFPCRWDGSKHPLIKDNLVLATTDESQVEEWFGRRWPLAWIGIPTGPATAVVLSDKAAAVVANPSEIANAFGGAHRSGAWWRRTGVSPKGLGAGGAL
jgi:hypothetical protein